METKQLTEWLQRNKLFTAWVLLLVITGIWILSVGLNIAWYTIGGIWGEPSAGTVVEICHEACAEKNEKLFCDTKWALRYETKERILSIKQLENGGWEPVNDWVRKVYGTCKEIGSGQITALNKDLQPQTFTASFPQTFVPACDITCS